MWYASCARDIAGGMEWVKENASDENIGKAMEKAKKQFAGTELKGRNLVLSDLVRSVFL